MQTFIPVPDFAGSASLLDRQRLGKQRVETLQIMGALVDPAKGWQNHPATRMWRGHEGALGLYQVATVGEWLSRGYRDTCLAKTFALLDGIELPDSSFELPAWWGDERVHLSHQANLVRKDPGLYGELFPGVEPMDGYHWPV